jgi:alkanesulfonate monooxygenase SsuD/methylene tetrahydromethanopterin reductase-like flavin-dependent oxidoreductase (luciferase family)
MVMKPVQRPHPPLWYGITNPDTVPWAATHAVNIVSLMPAPAVRPLTDRYRAEWQKLGRSESALPNLGLTRHIVLAGTDAEAKSAARSAYRPWRKHMEILWKQRGVPFELPLPLEFEELQATGAAFAGTASGARDYMREQSETAGVNYVACDVCFGTMSKDEALQTVELLGREVIPAFA